MISCYRLALDADKFNSSDCFFKFIQQYSVKSITAVDEGGVSFTSDSPAVSTCQPCDSIPDNEELARLVIQGVCSFNAYAKVLECIPCQVVRTTALHSLYNPDALGAVVIGLGAELDDMSALEALAEELQWEINLLTDAPSLEKPGLLLMDMDSTAIQIECIDEIAKLAGVGEQVAEVTELAMQGKLDFAESLRGRVATLENADEAILAEVRNQLPMTQGLPELVTILRSSGWKVAIASGGFTYFADYLKEQLPLDAAVSNSLEIIDGKLTGKVLGRIVDAQVKAETLGDLAEQFCIDRAQTVAAGDGANDLIMMNAASMGVAFHAKPIVAAQAATAIKYNGLEGIYYMLASA